MGCVGKEFRFTLITNDPTLAARADAAGVDFIGIDIERNDKSIRQGHVPNARISDHELEDLSAVGQVVRRGALYARLNPLHDGSEREIETALSHRAAALMLPYFTTAREVDRFVRLVDGRARVLLLLETAAAVVRLHDILDVSGIDEVIVGLNDLHLSAGVANHFELVVSDVMTMISDLVRNRGLQFGFGGLARAGDRDLPVPSDLVLAQHARLGSTAAWLSRSFFRADPSAIDLGAELAQLRSRLSYWASRPSGELIAQREALRCHLHSLLSAH